MVPSLSRKALVGVCFAALCLASAAAFAQSSSDRLRALASEGDVSSSSALPEEGGTLSRSPAFDLPSVDDGQDRVNPFAEPRPQTRTADEVDRMIREQAVNAALAGLLPMEPDEIRRLMERFDDTQQAVEVPVYPYPEPEVLMDTLSLDPGAKPPVVKVGVGHVTTITMLDVTGAPWPIQDLTFAGNFEVVTPEPGGHVIWVTGMSEFGYGNISLRLLNLKTPITFTLKTSRDSVYYRFDARVPEYGPYAQAPLIDGGLSIVAGNSVLGSILDGIPPEGAARLDVAGVDGRTSAYQYQDTTYVRTPLTLLSPGWSGSVSSADGMNVYAVTNAPVLLLSDRGQVVRARLSEEEPLHE